MIFDCIFNNNHVRLREFEGCVNGSGEIRAHMHLQAMLRDVCAEDTSGCLGTLRGWRSYGKNKETK